MPATVFLLFACDFLKVFCCHITIEKPATPEPPATTSGALVTTQPEPEPPMIDGVELSPGYVRLVHRKNVDLVLIWGLD